METVNNSAVSPLKVEKRFGSAVVLSTIRVMLVWLDNGLQPQPPDFKLGRSKGMFFSILLALITSFSYFVVGNYQAIFGLRKRPYSNDDMHG